MSFCIQIQHRGHSRHTMFRTQQEGHSIYRLGVVIDRSGLRKIKLEIVASRFWLLFVSGRMSSKEFACTMKALEGFTYSRCIHNRVTPTSKKLRAQRVATCLSKTECKFLPWWNCVCVTWFNQEEKRRFFNDKNLEKACLVNTKNQSLENELAQAKRKIASLETIVICYYEYSQRTIMSGLSNFVKSARSAYCRIVHRRKTVKQRTFKLTPGSL